MLTDLANLEDSILRYDTDDGGSDKGNLEWRVDNNILKRLEGAMERRSSKII